jgi:hypothetical protein
MVLVGIRIGFCNTGLVQVNKSVYTVSKNIPMLRNGLVLTCSMAAQTPILVDPDLPFRGMFCLWHGVLK